MEPVKAFFSLSTWGLRIAVLVLIYIIFYGTLSTLEYKNTDFLIAAGFALFGILLFIGGFMNKSTMTIIAAVILMLGCAYEIVMHYGFQKGRFVAIYFVLGAIALFFFANGNKKK
ncbi:MAG TPA: hypothetical protein PLT47_00055 [Bacteroidales bacterium]|nr:hypothetical protein [Bacteroidales bacterium]HQI69110.1 hypothetical protein [Bacteroidales bacterium]